MHLFCALRVTSAETLCVSASASQPECVSSQSFQNGVCVCVCAFCCAPCLLWWREAHLAFLVERGFPFGGERCTSPFLVERGAPCLFGEERRTLPFWWREVFLLAERGAPCLFGGERFHDGACFLCTLPSIGAGAVASLDLVLDAALIALSKLTRFHISTENLCPRA